MHRPNVDASTLILRKSSGCWTRNQQKCDFAGKPSLSRSSLRLHYAAGCGRNCRKPTDRFARSWKPVRTKWLLDQTRGELLVLEAIEIEPVIQSDYAEAQRLIEKRNGISARIASRLEGLLPVSRV